MTALKKTPDLIAQIFAAPLRAGGVIHAMTKQSRALLRAADKKHTTGADLAAMRTAQAKRERRALKRLNQQ